MSVLLKLCTVNSLYMIFWEHLQGVFWHIFPLPNPLFLHTEKGIRIPPPVSGIFMYQQVSQNELPSPLSPRVHLQRGSPAEPHLGPVCVHKETLHCDCIFICVCTCVCVCQGRRNLGGQGAICPPPTFPSFSRKSQIMFSCCLLSLFIFSFLNLISGLMMINAFGIQLTKDYCYKLI